MRKKCRGCGRRRAVSCFYVHPQMGDGRLNYCKDCVKAKVRADYASKWAEKREYDRMRNQDPGRRARQRAAAKERERRDPTKARAVSAVTNAVRSGKLVRQPCETCGATPSEGHHDDYSKPLSVRWLCFRHHRELHGQRTVAQVCVHRSGH